MQKIRFERFKKFLFRLKREDSGSQQNFTPSVTLSFYVGLSEELNNFRPRDADVAELAYAYGLGPYGETLGGSTPSVRISRRKRDTKPSDRFGC